MLWWVVAVTLVLFLHSLTDRPQTHSDESRLANLLRRVSREDDRDRRLATMKQMRELIVHSENKVVSYGTLFRRPLLHVCQAPVLAGHSTVDFSKLPH